MHVPIISSKSVLGIVGSKLNNPFLFYQTNKNKNFQLLFEWVPRTINFAVDHSIFSILAPGVILHETVLRVVIRMD